MRRMILCDMKADKLFASLNHFKKKTKTKYKHNNIELWRRPAEVGKGLSVMQK